LILPLAHHNAIEALPVFAPVLVICVVLAIHFLRARRQWDEEDEELSRGAEGTRRLRE
jgi:uncharacterized membrane protein